MEAGARGSELRERVVELEVIPEDGGAGEKALRGAGMELGNATPVWGSGGNIFAAVAGGFGVQIAESGQAVGIVGSRGEKISFQSHGAKSGSRLRVEIGQRAIERDSPVAGVGVGGIEVCDRAEQRSRLLEVRSEDVDLGLLAQRGGVRCRLGAGGWLFIASSCASSDLSWPVRLR